MTMQTGEFRDDDWFVFLLTRRWDVISITYIGIPPITYTDDLKEQFGNYAIFSSPILIKGEEDMELIW